MAKTNKPKTMTNYKDYLVNQKKVFIAYEESLRKFGYADKEVEWNLKKQAEYQIESIDKYRPNINKPTKQQLNPYQLEYYEWLESVKNTGKLK